jgi:hypothetical protein
MAVTDRVINVLTEWAGLAPTTMSQTLCALLAAGPKGTSLPCGQTAFELLVQMLDAKFTELNVNLQATDFLGTPPNIADVSGLVHAIATRGPNAAMGGSSE